MEGGSYIGIGFVFEASDGLHGIERGGGVPIQSVAEHGGFEIWQSVCAPFCSVRALNSARMHGQDDMSVSAIGPIILFKGACGGHLVRRSPAQISGTPGFLLVTLYEAGHLTGMTENEPFEAHDGDLVLRDLDSSFEALRYPSQFQAILLPRKLLGLGPGDVPSLRILRRNDATVETVRTVMEEAFGVLRPEASLYSFEMMQRLLATIRMALLRPQASLSPRHAARQAQMRQIQIFIEQNLGRLDLSAETLLPEFGLSRATLYRLFEVQGGVRSYIVDRRLFRALLEISDMARRRGKIQRAAKRWGFSSPSNFNRSVQQVFGASPGALLRAPVTSDHVTLEFGQKAPITV